MRRGRALAAVAIVLALACCKRPPERSPAAPLPKRDQAVAARPPMIKAHAIATADKLGTLPPGVGLAPGSRVADAAVRTHLGEPVQLAALVKTGPLLLIFYRGGW